MSIPYVKIIMKLAHKKFAQILRNLISNIL